MLKVFEIIIELGIIGLIFARGTSDPYFSGLLILIFIYFKREWILNILKPDIKIKNPAYLFAVFGTIILFIGIVIAILAINLGIQDKDVKNIGILATSLAFISIALAYYGTTFQINGNEDTQKTLIKIDKAVTKLVLQNGKERE